MKRKRILITGGAGFIGSHLCERFVAEGHSVVAVDNLLTGAVKNLRGLERSPRFAFVKADVSECLTVSGRLDAVLNFASAASPPDYLKHPIETLMTGSAGTLNGLELARAKKAVFLMASTSEVYGDPEQSPQKESYWGHVNPVGPRSCYDEAKRFSEALTVGYRRRYGVDAKIARIFNTYGPRMRPEDGRVVPNFITQAITGRPITVYGDGSQTRSYCHVDDLVEGVVRLMRSRVSGPVNFGNPNEMSVFRLAKLILRMTGSKSHVIRKPLPVDDPRRRCPDIALAKKELGWAPAIPLEEGLRETIAYFREAVL